MNKCSRRTARLAKAPIDSIKINGHGSNNVLRDISHRIAGTERVMQYTGALIPRSEERSSRAL